MTSLDPSHIPSSSNDRHHGQAVQDSVSAPTKHHGHSSSAVHGDDPSSSTTPSWKGAWARRQAAKEEERRKKEQDDDRKGKGKLLDQRIPVPPIPDLRYEQGVLMSIRPFLHRVERGKKKAKAIEVTDSDEIIVGEKNEELDSNRSPAHEERHDERVDDEKRTAIVSSALTAEGAEQGLAPGEESDIFAGPLMIEWSQVTYIIFRDQFVYPLLQGLLWGAGGLWLASFWNWNKSRLASKSSTSSSSPSSSRGTAGLLSRPGLRTR